MPIDYKQCVQKDRLPSGYVVPEGDMIMWSAYAMGRSPFVFFISIQREKEKGEKEKREREEKKRRGKEEKKVESES